MKMGIDASKRGDAINEGDLMQRPHRRYNPLTREWVLVSPQRTARPWQGRVEQQIAPALVTYDPNCYLSPHNPRAAGQKNPNYTSTFVCTNDFPALISDGMSERLDPSGRGLMLSESESGVCRVVCFSPRYDLTLSRMEISDIAHVVDLWAAQTAELGALPDIDYVQVFENRGEIMGCSNPHPHCQIWASEKLPNEPAKELRSQLAFRAGSIPDPF